MQIIPYLFTENGNFISNCMLCEILHFEFLELFSLREEENWPYQDWAVFVSPHQNWPVFVRPNIQY